MSPWLLLFIPVVVAFVFAIRWRVKEDQKDNANLNETWEQLNQTVLEVSLLVASNCPNNRVAHQMVIYAAQCLVYPKVTTHTIVTASMIALRYHQGFEYLEQARALATPLTEKK